MPICQAGDSPAHHRISRWPCFSSASSVTFSIAGGPSDKTERSWLVQVRIGDPVGVKPHFLTKWSSMSRDRIAGDPAIRSLEQGRGDRVSPRIPVQPSVRGVEAPP